MFKNYYLFCLGVQLDEFCSNLITNLGLFLSVIIKELN